MREIPRAGERYRHFKNRDYQIVALARHSETGEWMVVYQALYGDFGVWVRPLSMFLEPVDRKKYPDASQRFRFERVALPGAQEDGKNCSEYAGGRTGAGRQGRPEAYVREERPEANARQSRPEAYVRENRPEAYVRESRPEVNAWQGRPEADARQGRESGPDREAGALSPLLSEFLDTDSLEKRLEILQRMRGRVGRREVESLCFCLDVKLSGETVEEQLENLAKSLRMQQRYDASRLRR